MVAATEAERVHAYGEAAALLERALELWDRVEDAAARADSDRVAILARAAAAHGMEDDHVRQETLLRRALDEVDPNAAPARAAALMERLHRSQWNLNRQDESMATLERALELLPDEPGPERAALLSARAKTLMLRSRYHAACDASREAIAVARAVGEPATSRPRVERWTTPWTASSSVVTTARASRWWPRSA